MKKLFAALTVCTCGFSAVANAYTTSWHVLYWNADTQKSGFHEAEISNSGWGTQAECLLAAGRFQELIASSGGPSPDGAPPTACVLVPAMK